MIGSPPQVRGKHKHSKCSACCLRITPAGAGKTALWRAREFKVEDHPRRCGENRFPLAFKLRVRGSPPQVRGKH